jgi:hypothetical protein
LQVVHTSPLYDLQLLRIWSDGLDEMARQTEQMVQGSHPRFATITAVNEDPHYYVRLLDFIRRFRQSLSEDEFFERRSGIDSDNFRFLLAEYQFRGLPGFLAYANRLPRRLLTLFKFYRETQDLDFRLCCPKHVERAAREARMTGNPVPEEVNRWLEKRLIVT